MKIRKLLSFALACCMLMAVLLPAGAVEDTDVDYGVEGSLTAEHVYIDPVQVGENTYHYYDESGELLAMFVANEAETYSATQKYSIDWKIPAKSIKHSSVEIDTTQGAEVHHKIYQTAGTLSFVGYYLSAVDKYTWFNPPSTQTLEGYFICATSHPVNFAIQNDGKSMNQYYGTYYLAPL